MRRRARRLRLPSLTFKGYRGFTRNFTLLQLQLQQLLLLLLQLNDRGHVPFLGVRVKRQGVNPNPFRP